MGGKSQEKRGSGALSAKSGTENSGGRWHGEKRVITQQSLVDRRLRKKKKQQQLDSASKMSLVALQCLWRWELALEG